MGSLSGGVSGGVVGSSVGGGACDVIFCSFVECVHRGFDGVIGEGYLHGLRLSSTCDGDKVGGLAWLLFGAASMLLHRRSSGREWKRASVEWESAVYPSVETLL